MPDPLAGTLAQRLDTLERRLDELSRRSTGHGAPIASCTLTSDSAIVEFSSLPQHFRHLHLVLSAGHTASGVDAIRCQFNGVTSGYDVQYGQFAGTSYTASRILGVTGLEVGVVCGTGNRPDVNTSVATIANYSETNRTFVTAQSAFLAGVGQLCSWQAAGYYWGADQIIRSLRLFPLNGQFTAGTTVSVYGLR